MDRRRVAELLGVVSKAMAELAEEFTDDAEPAAPQRQPTARRRERAVLVPAHVSDLDVAAARRALRRAGV